MKKIFAVAAFLTILFIYLGGRAYAYTDQNTQSVAEATGADKIQSDLLSKDELSGDKKINLFEKAWEILCHGVKSNGLSAVKSCGLILCMLVLCCVMHALRFNDNPALDTACGFISVLVLSATAYSVLYNLFITVTAAMEALSLAMAELLPPMAALYAYGGNLAAGTSATWGLTVFLSVLSLICTKIILPLLQTGFALALSGALPGSISLSSLSSVLKTTATTLLGFGFSLLSFLLYFQTAIAATGDNFAARSVRFATGTFVPIIGGALGEAAKTVAASVSVIKGTVGTVGIVTVLALTLPAVILTLLYKLMLLVCSVAAKTLGCERESALLSELCGILNVLLALTLGAGCVAIIGFALFLKSGVRI